MLKSLSHLNHNSPSTNISPPTFISLPPVCFLEFLKNSFYLPPYALDNLHLSASIREKVSTTFFLTAYILYYMNNILIVESLGYTQGRIFWMKIKPPKNTKIQREPLPLTSCCKLFQALSMQSLICMTLTCKTSSCQGLVFSCLIPQHRSKFSFLVLLTLSNCRKCKLCF